MLLLITVFGFVALIAGHDVSNFEREVDKIFIQNNGIKKIEIVNPMEGRTSFSRGSINFAVNTYGDAGEYVMLLKMTPNPLGSYTQKQLSQFFPCVKNLTSPIVCAEDLPAELQSEKWIYSKLSYRLPAVWRMDQLKSTPLVPESWTSAAPPRLTDCDSIAKRTIARLVQSSGNYDGSAVVTCVASEAQKNSIVIAVDGQVIYGTNIVKIKEAFFEMLKGPKTIRNYTWTGFINSPRELLIRFNSEEKYLRFRKDRLVLDRGSGLDIEVGKSPRLCSEAHLFMVAELNKRYSNMGEISRIYIKYLSTRRDEQFDGRYEIVFADGLLTGEFIFSPRSRDVPQLMELPIQRGSRCDDAAYVPTEHGTPAGWTNNFVVSSTLDHFEYVSFAVNYDEPDY